MLKHIGGAGRPLLERARVTVGFLGEGRRSLEALAENHYLATDELARRLGLGDDVREALRQSYERWDGKGAYGLKGADVVIASRLINLADVVEVFRRTGGVDAALAVARERSGTQFDPELVEIFCNRAPMLFSDLDGATSWDLVIDAEPSLSQTLPSGNLDDALEAIGEFAELKSAWRMGHATAVAELAAEAARIAGLSAADVTTLRRSTRWSRSRPPGCLQRDLGQARTAQPLGSRASQTAPLPDGAHAFVLAGTRAPRHPGCAAPRASRRLGLPAGSVRRCHRTGRADPRGGRCVSGAHGEPTPPSGSLA